MLSTPMVLPEQRYKHQLANSARLNLKQQGKAGCGQQCGVLVKTPPLGVASKEGHAFEG